jgi:hypothetical protein
LPSGLRGDDSRKLDWGEKIRFLPILGIRETLGKQADLIRRRATENFVCPGPFSS